MNVKHLTRRELGDSADLLRWLQDGPIALMYRGRPFAVIVALPALSLTGAEELAEAAQAEINKRAGAHQPVIIGGVVVE